MIPLRKSRDILATTCGKKVEYWVIDRFQQNLTVFRGEDVEIVLQTDDVYRKELLPGFELPIARLLTEAEFSDENTQDDD